MLYKGDHGTCGAPCGWGDTTQTRQEQNPSQAFLQNLGYQNMPLMPSGSASKPRER